jgi:hypothetical protein
MCRLSLDTTSKGQAADRFILACLVYFVGMFCFE